MASLRHPAIGILRACGHRDIAAALRYDARGATRLLPLLGLTGYTPTIRHFAGSFILRFE
jgi:hypothetical protein